MADVHALNASMPSPTDQSLTIDAVRYYAEQAAAHATRQPGNVHAMQVAQQWQQRLMNMNAYMQGGAAAPGAAAPMQAP